MKEPEIFSHIDSEVSRLGLFESGEKIVAGVSGGPDSLFLLLWLASRRDAWGWELLVGHFDHRLRPDSSEDAAFVATLCEELSVPCTIGSADVGKMAREEGMGLEDAARRARFAFLAKEAVEHGCSKIALAHTADDQVETVLMHILRGAGLGGLVGMRPLTPFPKALWPEARELILVRPLLSVWKKDIEQSLQGLGYVPRRDPTNADPTFLRNRLRMTVIPQLEFIEPGFRASVLRLSRLLAEDDDYISGAVDGLWNLIARHGAGWVALELKSLRAAHPALLKRLARRAVEFARPAVGVQLEEQHLGLLAELVRGGNGTNIIDLPGGTVAAVDGVHFLVVPRSGLISAFSELYGLPIMESDQLELEVPGVTRLSPEWQLQAEVLEAEELRTWQDRQVAYLDYDLVHRPVVRTRKEGDRFQPLGMGAPKKLQDFLVDEKIPWPVRDRLPLVVVGDQIAWVCGVRIGDPFKVTEGTRRVLKLELRRVRHG
jgi:tRNA(Ile)-lysidine synthase